MVRHAGDLGFSERQQRRQALMHGPPYDHVGHIVVVVTVDSPKPHDGAPGLIGMTVAEFWRQTARGLSEGTNGIPLSTRANEALQGIPMSDIDPRREQVAQILGYSDISPAARSLPESSKRHRFVNEPGLFRRSPARHTGWRC